MGGGPEKQRVEMLKFRDGVLLELAVLFADHFSHVQLFVTPWTVALQAPLSMGFSRQEHWSGWPFPRPEDLPSPGIEPPSLESPASAGRFFTTVPPGKPEFNDECP